MQELLATFKSLDRDKIHSQDPEELQRRVQVFTDTHDFLSRESHWWCKYQDLALAFSEIFEFYDEQEIVQDIWAAMGVQLDGCQHCQGRIYSSMRKLEARLTKSDVELPFSTQVAGAVLGNLRRLMKRRFLDATQQPPFVAPAPPLASDGPRDDRSDVQALLECLRHPQTLQDAEVVARVAWSVARWPAARLPEEEAAGALFFLAPPPPSSLPPGPVPSWEALQRVATECLERFRGRVPSTRAGMGALLDVLANWTNILRTAPTAPGIPPADRVWAALELTLGTILSPAAPPGATATPKDNAARILKLTGGLAALLFRSATAVMTSPVLQRAAALRCLSTLLVALGPGAEYWTYQKGDPFAAVKDILALLDVYSYTPQREREARALLLALRPLVRSMPATARARPRGQASPLTPQLPLRQVAARCVAARLLDKVKTHSFGTQNSTEAKDISAALVADAYVALRGEPRGTLGAPLGPSAWSHVYAKAALRAAQAAPAGQQYQGQGASGLSQRPAGGPGSSSSQARPLSPALRALACTLMGDAAAVAVAAGGIRELSGGGEGGREDPQGLRALLPLAVRTCLESGEWAREWFGDAGVAAAIEWGVSSGRVVASGNSASLFCCPALWESLVATSVASVPNAQQMAMLVLGAAVIAGLGGGDLTGRTFQQQGAGRAPPRQGPGAGGRGGGGGGFFVSDSISHSPHGRGFEEALGLRLEPYEGDWDPVKDEPGPNAVDVARNARFWRERLREKLAACIESWVAASLDPQAVGSDPSVRPRCLSLAALLLTSPAPALRKAAVACLMRAAGGAQAQQPTGRAAAAGALPLSAPADLTVPLLALARKAGYSTDTGRALLDALGVAFRALEEGEEAPVSLWTSWPSDPDRHHAMEVAAALGAALTEGGREAGAGGRLAMGRGPSSLPEAPHPSALLECALDLVPVLSSLMEVVLAEMKRAARGVSNSLCGPARTALCLALRSLPLAASAIEVQGHMDQGLGAVFDMVPYLDAARAGGEVSELAQAWLDGVVPYLQLRRDGRIRLSEGSLKALREAAESPGLPLRIAHAIMDMVAPEGGGRGAAPGAAALLAGLPMGPTATAARAPAGAAHAAFRNGAAAPSYATRDMGRGGPSAPQQEGLRRPREDPRPDDAAGPGPSRPRDSFIVSIDDDDDEIQVLLDPDVQRAFQGNAPPPRPAPREIDSEDDDEGEERAAKRAALDPRGPRTGEGAAARNGNTAAVAGGRNNATPRLRAGPAGAAPSWFVPKLLGVAPEGPGNGNDGRPGLAAGGRQVKRARVLDPGVGAPGPRQTAAPTAAQAAAPRLRPIPPSTDDFFRTVASWPYDRLAGGALPHGMLMLRTDGAAGAGTSGRGALPPLPLSFSNSYDYQAAFWPLLLEELRAQLTQLAAEAFDTSALDSDALATSQVAEGTDGGPPGQVEGVMWSYTSCGSDKAEFSIRFQEGGRGGDKARGTSGAAAAPSSNSGPPFRTDDLVLMTLNRFDGALSSLSTAAHCLAVVRDAAWSRDSRCWEVRAVVAPQLHPVIRKDPQEQERHRRVFERMGPKAKWHMTPLSNLAPQLREFHALCQVPDLTKVLRLPLLKPPRGDEGAAAGASQATNLPDELSLAFRLALTRTYNTAQVSAIAASLDPKQPFTLVQGPPGTGKTSTIVGIASALIVAETARGPSLGGQAAKPAFAAAASAAAAQSLQPQGPCPRVLICTQSNAAADEIVRRIAREGLFGADGTRTTTRGSVVRFGRTQVISPAVLPYHIDTLAEGVTRGDGPASAPGATPPFAGGRHGASGVPTTSAAAGTGAAQAAGAPVAPKPSLRELQAQLRDLMSDIRAADDEVAALKGSHGGGRSGQTTPSVTPPASRQPSPVRGKDEGAAAPAANDLQRLEARRSELFARKRVLNAQMDKARAEEKVAAEAAGQQRRSARSDVLRRARVVVCTLSVAGGDLAAVARDMGDPSPFCALVVDEAAMALEPATLVPLSLLRKDGAKVVLVGDPQQLPSTLISTEAQRGGLSRSLFERLAAERGPLRPIMLEEQYRMHPEVVAYPSKRFYGGRLRPGRGITADSRSAPFHGHQGGGRFPPLRFWDLPHSRESGGAGSTHRNVTEAEFVVSLLRDMKRTLEEPAQTTVCVLTPYRGQLGLLVERLTTAGLMPWVEVATVDCFQGREADVVVFSSVRAGSNTVGFLADSRRLNVALTRARRSLWIVGHVDTLRRNPDWSDLIEDLRGRGMVQVGSSGNGRGGGRDGR